MNVAELLNGFAGAAMKSAISGLLIDKSAREFNFTGLAGSSVAMMLCSLPRQKAPILVIGDSPDDAGYLYHDLTRLVGEGSVGFFPSAYKRDIKFGKIDAPSEILRTESLSKWYADKSLRFVVASPEGLAERVASRDSVDSSTFRFAVGEETDMTQARKWLLDNGFSQVDYVYEPGNFSIRGSILDIFGYNYELPYRIDFFGDEIDSIRTFDIETQLSRDKLSEALVSSNVASDTRGVSLLEFIGDDTLIAVRSPRIVLGRVKEISQETFSKNALLADEGDKDALKNVVDAEDFAARFDSFWKIGYEQKKISY